MRPQELNLLIVFDAIMTEGSITQAAHRLSMTQPAVSNAVSRMRSAWKDELFVKDGRNIQPTLYAKNLWSQVKEPLISLTEAVDPKTFDPATSKRVFRIAVTDIIVDMVWPELRCTIEKEAPHVNIHAVPYTITNTSQVLENAEVDMVISATNIASDTFIAEYLFSPIYVCIMSHSNPLSKAPLTLESFALVDHLLVSLSGGATGSTDQILLQHGLSRRVAVTVNHFSAVVNIIKKSNLLCVIPISAVAKEIIAGDIVATKLPIELNPKHLSAIWHKRQDRDLGLIWLREHFKRIINHAVEHETIQAMQMSLKEN